MKISRLACPLSRRPRLPHATESGRGNSFDSDEHRSIERKSAAAERQQKVDVFGTRVERIGSYGHVSVFDVMKSSKANTYVCRCGTIKPYKHGNARFWLDAHSCYADLSYSLDASETTTSVHSEGSVKPRLLAISTMHNANRHALMVVSMPAMDHATSRPTLLQKMLLAHERLHTSRGTAGLVKHGTCTAKLA